MSRKVVKRYDVLYALNDGKRVDYEDSITCNRLV